MDWESLLSSERLSGAGQRAEGRSPFNQDYGRVLYSSAFRRLQDKTQVFPLGRNDYVRTRLTHSLEVSNVGRTLAQRLSAVIRARGEAGPAVPLDGIEDIVATACLAHDIGNPPFGHSGEDALVAALSGTEFADFAFEGNAQGFRLLARVCDPIRGCGLDLTAATLGAFTKYPCQRGARRSLPHVACKKFGINAEEAPLFERVADLCGLAKLSENVYARHPLAYLMEAADDISYLIADIEDAFVSDVIDFRTAAEQLNSLIGLTAEKIESYRREQGERGTLRHLRAIAVGACIRVVGDTIEKRYAELMDGSLSCSLLKTSPMAAAYEAVQVFSLERIYATEPVVRIEITGYNVIRRLMELCLQWVEAPDSALGRKIGITLHADPAQAEEKTYRFLHAVDYVSGMTDSYALQTYRTLYGC